MGETRARANSPLVARNVVGRSHLVRLLDGWAADDGALHAQLADRVRHLATTGALPAGIRLSSERVLADSIGVSRNTVGAASISPRVVSVRRCDALLELLAEELPSWSTIRPEGGASLWIRLPHGSATAFAERAERAGVSILAGPTFSSRDSLDDHVRVAFAAPIERVLAGARRLAVLWRQTHVGDQLTASHCTGCRQP